MTFFTNFCIALFFVWAIGRGITATLNLLFVKKMIDDSVQHQMITRFAFLRFHNGISICQYTTDISRSLLSITWSKMEGWKTSFFWKKCRKDEYEKGRAFFWQECEFLEKDRICFTMGWH